jgi:hypothetical protein
MNYFLFILKNIFQFISKFKKLQIIKYIKVGREKIGR